MKGTFKITGKYLEEIGACDEGLLAFKETYPDGGEYQEILDRCCAEGHTDWAMWLFHIVGFTYDVRTYDDFVFDETLDIIFAGRVKFKSGAVVRRLIAGASIKAGEGIDASEGIKAGWGIKAGEGIEADWGINAGENLEAGWGIKAGEGINAGKGIEAGAGFGIFAGLRVKVNLWTDYAKVIAKSKPENLISGYWEESI